MKKSDEKVNPKILNIMDSVKKGEELQKKYFPNQIDKFYAGKTPAELGELKRIQTRFATFQTFLSVFPCFDLRKKTNGEMKLIVSFDSCGKAWRLSVVGDSVLDLIEPIIRFIDQLPEEVKKDALKM